MLLKQVLASAGKELLLGKPTQEIPDAARTTGSGKAGFLPVYKASSTEKNKRRWAIVGKRHEVKLK
jgi:hypothetical protein